MIEQCKNLVRRWALRILDPSHHKRALYVGVVVGKGDDTSVVICGEGSTASLMKAYVATTVVRQKILATIADSVPAAELAEAMVMLDTMVAEEQDVRRDV